MRTRVPLLLLAAGCAAGENALPGGDDFVPPPSNGGNASQVASPPHVLALSAYDASVGTLLEAYGTSFADPDYGTTYLVFKGLFEKQSGASEPVDLEVEARWIDAGTVRWTGFGPYRNPMTASGNDIGTFRGTVGARTVTEDGKILDDPDPPSVALGVKPSILVHEFQPLSASCSGAIKRALGGAAYRVRVEAVGFDPVSFTYTLSAPSVDIDPISIRHVARGRFDSVGDGGDFSVPPVPREVKSYSTILSIQAVDREGKTHQTAFAIAVHRPLEVYYNGNIDVAEILAPVPVSGCIPGGEAGRAVVYSESMSETRSRGYDVNWNQSWLTTHTVATGSEQTVGLSETNGVGFATTDGQSFNWSLGMEVEGRLTIAELVEIGVSANSSRGGATNSETSRSMNRESGVNASTTTTETREASQQQGGQVGGGFSWSVTSEQSISSAFGGNVLPGSFGVFYRQTMRMMRRAAVVTYNQCGAATVIAELDFHDWTWAPDLALGTGCPPLPDSNLPKAACLIPPCAGQ